jgi:hypothetical protein
VVDPIIITYDRRYRFFCLKSKGFSLLSVDISRTSNPVIGSESIVRSHAHALLNSLGPADALSSLVEKMDAVDHAPVCETFRERFAQRLWFRVQG